MSILLLEGRRRNHQFKLCASFPVLFTRVRCAWLSAEVRRVQMGRASPLLIFFKVLRDLKWMMRARSHVEVLQREKCGPGGETLQLQA